MFCEHSLINLNLNYIVSRDIYFGLLHIMLSVLHITIFTWQESPFIRQMLGREV